MEIKCAICKISADLTKEQLVLMYELAGRDMSASEVVKMQEIMKGKTCTDNKFHAFSLGENFSEQVLKIAMEYKTNGNKLRTETEPLMEKMRLKIEELRIELADTTEKYESIIKETNLVKTKIEELELGFENLVGHKNVGLYI